MYVESAGFPPTRSSHFIFRLLVIRYERAYKQTFSSFNLGERAEAKGEKKRRVFFAISSLDSRHQGVFGKTCRLTNMFHRRTNDFLFSYVCVWRARLFHISSRIWRARNLLVELINFGPNGAIRSLSLGCARSLCTEYIGIRRINTTWQRRIPWDYILLPSGSASMRVEYIVYMGFRGAESWMFNFRQLGLRPSIGQFLIRKSEIFAHSFQSSIPKVRRYRTCSRESKLERSL